MDEKIAAVIAAARALVDSIGAEHEYDDSVDLDLDALQDLRLALADLPEDCESRGIE